MANQQTAAGGLQPPPVPNFLVLDSSTLDDKEQIHDLREYIKLDRIEFTFPEGLAKVPVFEECRALCDLENFDTMYDLAMQYMTGKWVVINIYNDDRSVKELGRMRVQDKFSDLREMQCVADYPWIVNWLCEFLAGHLSKKFPLPSREAESKAAKKVQERREVQTSS